MQRRDVVLPEGQLHQLLALRLLADCAQHLVVQRVHRSGVQPRRNKFLELERLLVEAGELLVEVSPNAREGAGRQRHPPALHVAVFLWVLVDSAFELLEALGGVRHKPPFVQRAGLGVVVARGERLLGVGALRVFARHC